MAQKSKRPRVDRARPVVGPHAKTDAGKVEIAHTLAVTAQASPSWGQAVDVHPALVRVTKNADAISANAKVILELQTQLADAMNKQGMLRRDFEVSIRSMQSAVEVFAAGSVDVVRSFGFEVQGYTKSGPLAAPEDLHVKTGRDAGTVAAAWKSQTRNGYVVQFATDPANPATYSAQKPSTRARCTLGGFTSGAVVHVRIAAVDPTSASGMSPWCDWRAGTAK